MGKDIKQYFSDKVIRVDRGGPESRIGKLLDAGDDFFTVLTENDGVVYYHTRHIKSFTENKNRQFEMDIEVPEDLEYKKAENFQELLESLSYLWVRINRGGPDMVEGILIEVKDDFVYVVTDDEVVRITIIHIKNVSYGPKIKMDITEEPMSQGSETIQVETYESHSNKSRQKSKDKSKDKFNETHKEGKEHFEDDLSLLLSLMEKFLKHYSRSN
ncbi:spore coat protein [Neobacillus drentensis]|uniref:spore coat protein n=1 Tax=Neobacillus drentensis TaxID=220684 RepID=UPI003000635F